MSENIVVVKLLGGLGNQMFQYAAGLSKARQQSEALKIDVSDFQKNYKLHGYDLKKWCVKEEEASSEEISSLTKRKLPFFKNKVFKEKGLIFNSSFLSVSGPIYLDGYWQTEKYFKNIRSELLTTFIPAKTISSYTKEVEEKIQSSEMAVCIHVRRGDYLLSKNQSIHGSCTMEYYEKGISYFKEKFKSTRFFVFSDDILWCKENLKLGSDAFFVDGNSVERNHEDIYLMSKCRHNIIANSSFSWWGAWLNKNAGQEVIAPKQWFVTGKHNSQDIYCEGWIKL